MRFGLDHLCGGEGRHGRPWIGYAFDFQPQTGEGICDGVQGRVGIKMVAQPINRELHRARPAARVGMSNGSNP